MLPEQRSLYFCLLGNLGKSELIWNLLVIFILNTYYSIKKTAVLITEGALCNVSLYLQLVLVLYIWVKDIARLFSGCKREDRSGKHLEVLVHQLVNLVFLKLKLHYFIIQLLRVIKVLFCQICQQENLRCGFLRWNYVIRHYKVVLLLFLLALIKLR